MSKKRLSKDQIRNKQKAKKAKKKDNHPSKNNLVIFDDEGWMSVKLTGKHLHDEEQELNEHLAPFELQCPTVEMSEEVLDRLPNETDDEHAERVANAVRAAIEDKS